MVKIYTKKGDSGNSRLYSNELLHKGHNLFNILGALDELNIRLGFAYWTMYNNWMTYCFEGDVARQIAHLQKNCILLSSSIATVSGGRMNSVKFSETETDILEDYIDEMDKCMPKLTKFINPHMYDCCLQIHLCRTQCRLVERYLNTNTHDQENIEIPDYVTEKIYINRLSDYLFNLARFLEYRMDARNDIILEFIILVVAFILCIIVSNYIK